MISIELNHESFSQDLDKITLAQAIEVVNSEGLNQNESITGIVIDNNVYPVEAVTDLLDVPLSQLKNPSIQIKSSYEMAFEALDDCNAYIDTIIDKILVTTNEFNCGNLDDANILFADLIELLDLYIQLITRIHATARKGNSIFFKDKETIKNLEIHLFSIVKALVPARENNDIVMLSDLLEYELIDNLKQWKIKAIPMIKESQLNI